MGVYLYKVLDCTYTNLACSTSLMTRVGESVLVLTMYYCTNCQTQFR
jgi:hypothetical protein